MEILEIVSGAQINGAVVHCALLCREFTRRGHGVTLVCRQDAKIKALLADTPVNLVESDLHRFPFDEIRRIKAIAQASGSQVIHTHMTRAHNFGVVLRRFCNIPVVATAHSHIVQPLTWMFNDYVIAVSDATRKFQVSRNFVRPGNIETVYGFTDVGRQAAVPADAGVKVRAELGVNPDAPVFGIIGDIIPRKGHTYLVRALSEIVRTLPTVRMLVVGDPKRAIGQKYYEEVQQEARRLHIEGNIVWAGYRSDVANIMRSLDVYVLASLDEMFPVAALEAMAAKRPIVATDVGGVPECLTNEVTGLLVPKANPGALAEAIQRLLTDRVFAANLASRARRLVHDQFSVQSQAPRTEDVFRRVIARFDPIRSARETAGKMPSD